MYVFGGGGWLFIYVFFSLYCKVKKDYINLKYKSMYIVLSEEWVIMDILLENWKLILCIVLYIIFYLF